MWTHRSSACKTCHAVIEVVHTAKYEVHQTAQLNVDMLSCVIAEGSKRISIATGTVFIDRCFRLDRRDR